MVELKQISKNIKSQITVNSGTVMSKKVSASTLIEVIISLVIILIVFVLSINIFTKVTQSGIAVNAIIANNKMQVMISEATNENSFEEKTVQSDDLVFQQTVADYTDYPDLLILKIEATQNGKSLGVMQQLLKKQK